MFADLPGWDRDDPRGALRALQKSCAVFEKRAPDVFINPSDLKIPVGAFRTACASMPQNADADTAARYIETYFAPYAVDTELGNVGLFTGYYEAMLNGSRVKTDRYSVPLHKRPDNLVMVELGEFRPHLRGERIAGFVDNGKLQPYADRAAIETGALSGKNLELVWVDDADAAFFLHIQGSGRVALPDGTTMRVGYDGQNGHVYTAIGRELIARGELTPQNTNLQSIRDWLKAHPVDAVELRRKNPSYIFFRELTGDGPIGAQNVALTPTRSLAVDPRFVPYGAPVFLDVPHPVKADLRIQRLMVAQDTGGAIRGPVRGDFFWGAGPKAEENAGPMKARGRMWVLLPRDVPAIERKIILPTKK